MAISDGSIFVMKYRHIDIDIYWVRKITMKTYFFMLQ